MCRSAGRGLVRGVLPVAGERVLVTEAAGYQFCRRHRWLVVVRTEEAWTEGNAILVGRWAEGDEEAGGWTREWVRVAGLVVARCSS